jgi:hypothetical protein
VVTVALDAAGAEAAGPSIDAAHPEHPSLIDTAHRLDELLGINNVPMAVWIDEGGTMVRPPEVAHPGRSVLRDLLAEHGVPADAPPLMLETLAEASKIRVRPERYANAIRDWVARGADSRYALAPDEVVARSRPRPREASRAAAHFELGQHLYPPARSRQLDLQAPGVVPGGPPAGTHSPLRLRLAHRRPELRPRELLPAA